MLTGAQMHWNATGSAVLAMAYADFDATNQSYYGEQKLHFLPSEVGKWQGLRCILLHAQQTMHSQDSNYVDSETCT